MESKSIAPLKFEVSVKQPSENVKSGRGAGGSGALGREWSWIYMHTTYTNIFETISIRSYARTVVACGEYGLPRCSLGGTDPAWGSLSLQDL